VARLEARAAEDAAAGRSTAACALYESAYARSGGARELLAVGEVRARAGDLEAAERSFRAAARAAGDDVSFRAEIAHAEGDLAWRRGELAEAVSNWSAALDARPDRAEERLLEAKIAAAGDPELARAARALFLGERDERLALAEVAMTPHPLSAYLVGRALFSRGEASAAVAPLERAAAGPLPGALHREAIFLVAQARCSGGAAEMGRKSLAELTSHGASAADRARAAEAGRRCAWEHAGR
jgi:tetratricopeptide (TPR) repeat protein